MSYSRCYEFPQYHGPWFVNVVTRTSYTRTHTVHWFVVNLYKWSEDSPPMQLHRIRLEAGRLIMPMSLLEVRAGRVCIQRRNCSHMSMHTYLVQYDICRRRRLRVQVELRREDTAMCHTREGNKRGHRNTPSIYAIYDGGISYCSRHQSYSSTHRVRIANSQARSCSCSYILTSPPSLSKALSHKSRLLSFLTQQQQLLHLYYFRKHHQLCQPSS